MFEFYIKKNAFTPYSFGEEIVNYRIGNDKLFVASYVSSEQTSSGFLIDKEHVSKNIVRIILTNCNESFKKYYFKTDGHWIYCVEDINDSSLYKLTENNDVYSNKFGDIVLSWINYLWDVESNKIICMDSDGNFNIKNSGNYVLMLRKENLN